MQGGGGGKGGRGTVNLEGCMAKAPASSRSKPTIADVETWLARYGVQGSACKVDEYVFGA